MESPGDLRAGDPVGTPEHDMRAANLLRRAPVNLRNQKSVGLPAAAPLHEERDLGLAQSPKRNASRLAREPAENLRHRSIRAKLAVATGADPENPRVAELVGHKLEEQKRGAIGPVEIIEHDQQRSFSGDLLEERRDRIEEIEPRVL
jgi:hypothetical protein